MEGKQVRGQTSFTSWGGGIGRKWIKTGPRCEQLAAPVPISFACCVDPVSRWHRRPSGWLSRAFSLCFDLVGEIVSSEKKLRPASIDAVRGRGF